MGCHVLVDEHAIVLEHAADTARAEVSGLAGELSVEVLLEALMIDGVGVVLAYPHESWSVLIFDGGGGADEEVSIGVAGEVSTAEDGEDGGHSGEKWCNCVMRRAEKRKRRADRK